MRRFRSHRSSGRTPPLPGVPRGGASARRRARPGSRLLLALLVLLGTSGGEAQTQRRLATIDALQQFPNYYHLQSIVLRGEIAEEGIRRVLRTDEGEIRVLLEDNVRAASGPVEVRGQLIDTGRLEQSDPRLTGYLEHRDADGWPRPGEELFLRVSAISEAALATAPSVRALALEPWRFEGERVTLVGNFRGRNLFGDLPDSPRKSRYDFVLRGAEGAVWVTNLRPRGRGFELDVDRRIDTNRWVEVTGTVVRERGLIMLDGTQIALAHEPETAEVVDEVVAPPVALQPVQVVFSSPTPGELGVASGSTVRVQFSRGLNETTLKDKLRVSYVGGPEEPALAFTMVYDAATRSIELRFAQPLERFRTVRVEVLEGVTAFDGAPVEPWTLTFSIGG